MQSQHHILNIHRNVASNTKIFDVNTMVSTRNTIFITHKFQHHYTDVNHLTSAVCLLKVLRRDELKLHELSDTEATVTNS